MNADLTKDSSEPSPEEENRPTPPIYSPNSIPTDGEIPGNIVAGMIGGVLSSIVAAIVWATISVVTGFQIGWAAIGVGFLVAYIVRIWGKGNTVAFGVIGAVFALLGCVLGNVLTIIGFVAQEYEVGIMEALISFDYAFLPELMIETAAPMDFLFYALALYSGYKYSIGDAGESEEEPEVA
ncbi:MAG: hypothetical protein AAF212_01120 [Verrucomicrobiota bacterium]